MINWVLFGHGHLLGDIVEVIIRRGENLRRIITNAEEPTDPRRLPFNERLEQIKKAFNLDIQLTSLADFIPSEDESYNLGFTGFKRAPLVEQLVARYNIVFSPLIDPTTNLARSASIGPGCFVNSGAVIAPFAAIGAHTVINRGVTFGHNSQASLYCVIQPGANIAGYVRLGYGAYVGMGANIIEGVHIGDKSVIGAGAVVIDDVPPNQLFAGVPAKYKKQVNDA